MGQRDLRPTSAPKRPAAHGRGPGEGMVMAGILLVEDDPDTRRMLEAWLQWMGHDVFGAASATEAVHLVEGSTQVPAPALHVAVLDIVMPDHSGVELLQYLRRRPVTRQIPAIFLSASELDTDRPPPGPSGPTSCPSRSPGRCCRPRSSRR